MPDFDDASPQERETGGGKALALAVSIPGVVIAAVLGTVYYENGPTRAAEAAEQQLALVSKHGTLGEQCAAAKDAEAAWLKAQDEKKYDYAALIARIDCSLADTAGTDMPADDEERNKINARAAAETEAELKAATAAAESASQAEAAAQRNAQYDAAEAQLNEDLARDIPKGEEAINAAIANGEIDQNDTD